MHVDTRPRTYTAVDGSVRQYRQALLRRSYRDAAGKPAKQTLANLSVLPDEAVEALRKVLAGKILMDTEEAFSIERAVGHGHVAAVGVMATRLRFADLLGPRCREGVVNLFRVKSGGTPRSRAVIYSGASVKLP